MNTDSAQAEKVLVLACGALAHEIQALKKLNGWTNLTLKCLDAALHNRPERIAAKLAEKINTYRDQYDRIIIGYGECGSGGEIDKLVSDEGLERLPGAHCYAFYAGLENFDRLSDQEPGTFYLTDYLAQHFERLIIEGFKLNQHPELKPMLFGNYQRVVYLSQKADQALISEAKNAAAYLGLEFEHIHTGYGELQASLDSALIVSAK